MRKKRQCRSIRNMSESMLTTSILAGIIPMFKEHVYFIVDTIVVAANLSQKARAKRNIVAKPVVLDAETPLWPALP